MSRLDLGFIDLLDMSAVGLAGRATVALPAVGRTNLNLVYILVMDLVDFPSYITLGWAVLNLPQLILCIW